MPKRRKGESKRDFISRCIGDDAMEREFPKHKQRIAVCHSYAGKKKTTESMIGEKAVSKAQQMAAAIALHGDPDPDGAAAEMKKSMSKKELRKFAETKRKGLPDKVSETTYDRWKYDTIDQLEQELEDLQKEHEEAVLTGEDEEILDQLEQDINELEDLIAWKKQHMKEHVNVIEDFKNMRFREFLDTDLLVNEQVSAAQLQQMVQQLAGLLMPAVGLGLETPEQERARLGTRAPAPVKRPLGLETPEQERARIGVRPKPKVPAAEYERAIRARRAMESHVQEGVWDFMKGAGREAASKIQQAAQAYGGRSTLGQIIGAGMEAHRAAAAAKKQAAAQPQQQQAQAAAQPQQQQAQAAAQPQQVVALAKNIIATARAIPNGQQILNKILADLGAKNKQLQAAITQVLKGSMTTQQAAAPSGA